MVTHIVMSKSYYQCFLFKQFTTWGNEIVIFGQMSKSYYQCFLFKQFTTFVGRKHLVIGCQRAIINVSFSSNSQPPVFAWRGMGGCQRAIINVSFSSNSQRCLEVYRWRLDVKELLSMFPFQAIHNGRSRMSFLK